MGRRVRAEQYRARLNHARAVAQGEGAEGAIKVQEGHARAGGLASDEGDWPFGDSGFIADLLRLSERHAGGARKFPCRPARRADTLVKQESAYQFQTPCMYQSQLLAPAPGEFVFSRPFVAYFFFQRIFFSECLLLKKKRKTCFEWLRHSHKRNSGLWFKIR